MRYKHVFAVCAYKGLALSGAVHPALKALTVPSHIIIARPLPAAILTGWPGNTACRSVYGRGECGIRMHWNFAFHGGRRAGYHCAPG